MSNPLGRGDFGRLGPVTITEEQVPSNVTIGEPFPLSQHEYDGMLKPRKNTMPETTPILTAFHRLQTEREQRDTALWDALWATLDPKLRATVQETARDLADAEQALAGARAQLADIDARPPAKLADVPKRAAARGAVVGEIAQYEVIVTGARQAYEQAARAALTAAQGIVAKQSKQSELAHKEAEAEYRRLKEVARQSLAEANETRGAIQRLSEKVNSGNVDLFR